MVNRTHRRPSVPKGFMLVLKPGLNEVDIVNYSGVGRGVKVDIRTPSKMQEAGEILLGMFVLESQG